MINLVEMIAEPNENQPAPCRHGNIIMGHACYCHNAEAPYRKCPIWRHFGTSDLAEWNTENCEWFQPNKATRQDAPKEQQYGNQRGKGSEMEVVYTCECGGQTWTVYGWIIECTQCGTRYRLFVYPESPTDFNSDAAARRDPDDTKPQKRPSF